MSDREILVTGGAGFIGSHLVDRIKGKNKVYVYDNFSNASIENERENVTYYREDILDIQPLVEKVQNIDTIFHFAATPSVRKSSENPVRCFRQNLRGTINLLEAARKNDVSRIVFASSSTVYGEAEIPTPENAPLKPISNYGSCKASSEMFLKSYYHTYGIDSVILRYANIYGPRSGHGVMHDFFHKLKEDPTRLEILGDGKQKKSYLYIDDCINATLTALESKKGFDIFNIGSETQITVDKIAEMVSDEMKLNPEFVYTGGNKGWRGDVTEMLLDINKITSLGWGPKYSVEEGIRKYVRWLKD